MTSPNNVISLQIRTLARGPLAGVMIVFAMALGGCESTQTATEIPQTSIAVPSVVKAPGEASFQIGMVRSSHAVASAIHYWPTYNSHTLAGLLTGEFIEFSVPAGAMTVGARCFGGWSESWKETVVSLQGKPGDKRFFLVRPEMSKRDACLSLTEISEARFRSLVAGSRGIPLGARNMR